MNRIVTASRIQINKSQFIINDRVVSSNTIRLLVAALKNLNHHHRMGLTKKKNSYV